jgi:hypothetical protein
LCAEQDPLDQHATVDRRRHGREEHRRVETFAVTDRLPPEWQAMVACAARITRLSWCKDTRTGLWQARREAAYYASQIELTAGGRVRVRGPRPLGDREPGASRAGPPPG